MLVGVAAAQRTLCLGGAIELNAGQGTRGPPAGREIHEYVLDVGRGSRERALT